MADKLISKQVVGGESFDIPFADNGDGTYSEKVKVSMDALPAGSNTIGAVKSVPIPVDTAFSGQITVTTAGTSVQGSNVPLTDGVWIKALAANTGKMYIGQATGDNRNKYELSAGETIFVPVTNLNQIWIDASVNGEKVCWLKA